MKEHSELKYLQCLAELYPTIAKASTEIINLQSILNLPKGTEHFITDIHGEYEAFSHVLKNGSGSVKKKIDDVFGRTLSTADKNALATLIYYPREKMDLVKKTEKNMDEWYRITLYRLIEVCKTVASKYTRSKVRKALPGDFAYVIEELITEKAEVLDKEAYYSAIVDTIISIGRAEEFIVALGELIQRLVIDHLHILGDIYDRGPGPDRIMDKLMSYHSLDIQWGNHDVLWMGAAAGQLACIANVVRNSVRYGNLDLLEDGYGINMVPLAAMAMKVYGDDPCQLFQIKANGSGTSKDDEMNRKIHKAIVVIQFKLEGQLIRRRGEFGMENRMLLDRIDYERGTIVLEGKEYRLLDTHFPTIDPRDPCRLTREEEDVMDQLKSAFLHCGKLQQHMTLLLNRGSLYKVYNNNLLYHGCVPLDEKGEFLKVNVYGKEYSGKALYDALEKYVRKAFFAVDEEEREKGKDILWFIWSCPSSPLFGKIRWLLLRAIFWKKKRPTKKRRILIIPSGPGGSHGSDSGGVRSGDRRPYRQRPCAGASEFGESPVKCGGKVLVIDGGFSKAYQAKTGIAGYTLIYNSYGMMLVAHMPFTSTREAIVNETDIHSERIMVKMTPHRMHVGDTDNGKALKERIGELKELLEAYRNGWIIEKT